MARLLKSAAVPLAEAMKSPLNVLVVDDEPLIRWSVCEVLADCGHAVCEAATARRSWNVCLAAPVCPM